ncbi:MAG: YggS family pyridoxal phosphate-dependent enzyme [Hyphomicrobiales bacterium]
MSRHPANSDDDIQNSLADTSHQALDDVRARIALSAQKVERDENDVTLIAVSKTFDGDHIRPILKAGQKVFGENRVQEAQSKWPALREDYPDILLHLIGPLQTNKVKDAVALFDVIETVDRPKLARALAKEMEKQQRFPKLFVQVNTGEEPQKAGVMPSETDAFVAQCRDEFNLDIFGLMCIPPFDEEPSLHFALLKKIAERNGITQLSMGMSSDFDVAVEFGATYVRVGSAIFGARSYPVA